MVFPVRIANVASGGIQCRTRRKEFKEPRVKAKSCQGGATKRNRMKNMASRCVLFNSKSVSFLVNVGTRGTSQTATRCIVAMNDQEEENCMGVIFFFVYDVYFC